jgi:hypothetical protein
MRFRKGFPLVVAATGLLALGTLPDAGVSSVVASATKGSAGTARVAASRAAAKAPHHLSVPKRGQARRVPPIAIAPGTNYHFRRTTSRGEVVRTAGGVTAVPSQHTHRSAQGNTTPAGTGVHPNIVTPSPPSQLDAFAGTTQDSAIGTFGPDQGGAPPDPNLAVGPNDVVEATNVALYFFTRDGSFEGSADIPSLVPGLPASWVVTDPRVLYDPSNDRFYFTVEAYDTTSGSCANDVLLLRTDSGDPTGTWNGFVLFNAKALTAPAVPFADQPGLGFSNNVVAVTWNYFSCTNGSLGNFAGGQLDVVQKSDLLSVSPTAHSVAVFTGGPPGNQPVVSLGSTQVQYVVYNNSDPCLYPFTGPCPKSIGVDPFTGTPEQQNVTPNTEVDEPITGTSVGVSPPLTASASQSGTSTLLETDDDRLLNAVWQNGTIWTDDTTNCTPSGDSTTRSCLNIVSIDADANGSVTGVHQLPFVGVNGSYLYYPAISVDSTGNAVVVFDESSSSTFESIRVAGIVGGNISSFTTLHTSATFYDNGPTNYMSGHCPTQGCRWGDYSGVAQDPSHPADVWVVSEDTGNENTVNCPINTCWSTYIGRYTYAAPAITSLTPAAGPTAGGQTVTVAGSDFLSGVTFTLGGNSATPSNVTPDSFTITTPVHAAGYVVGVATDSLGNSGSSNPNAGYIYVGPGSYVPLTPFRILDTRTGLCGGNSCGSVGPGGVLTLQISGYTDPTSSQTVPANASAVVLNVTAVNDSSFSLLTIWPNGTMRPLAANLNFNAHVNTANLATVALGQSGEVKIFNALGTLNIVADVQGYFIPAPAGTPTGEFHAIPPLRVCDTRSSQPTNVCNQGHTSNNLLGQGQSVKVNVTGQPAGVGGSPPVVPTDGTAVGVVLNLTAVSGTAGTYLSVFPTNSSGNCPYGSGNPPPTANINVNAFTNQANRVFVPLGADSTGGPTTDVCVYNSLGSINFILDANGWFGSSGAAVGKQFQPIVPTRVCDTRAGQGTLCDGQSLTAGAALTVAVAGQGGIPSSGPVAIIANLAAVSGTQGTFLAAYPADVVRPNASDLNVNAHQNLPNLVVVELSSSPAGNVDIFNSAGTIDAVLDVQGWFQ